MPHFMLFQVCSSYVKSRVKGRLRCESIWKILMVTMLMPSTGKQQQHCNF